MNIRHISESRCPEPESAPSPALILGWVVGAILCVAGSVGVWVEWSRASRPVTVGLVEQITRYSPSSLRSVSGPSYKIEYTYTVAGKKFKHGEILEGTPGADGAVQVMYSPENPDDATINPRSGITVWAGVTVLGVIMIIGSCLFRWSFGVKAD